MAEHGGRDRQPPGALSGIRVLDLTTVVFGPYASQLLADYGADVIKIEAPTGDPVRSVGPSADEDMAALYLGFNRNKRSVVLDLKRPAGVAALLRLVDRADVLVHSMRPQKMQALGLGPELVRARNDRLVYAGLYGFGEGGAYSGRPAYDDTVQGLSGLADLMDRAVGEPRYLPTIIADKVSGLFAAHAILAALMQRERTGRGQTVEVPMFEVSTAFALAEHYHGRHVVDDSTTPDIGYIRALEPSRRPFRTSDGHVCFLPYNDTNWRRFFIESGNASLADDPRFADLASRTRNVGELYEIVAAILARGTTEHWLAFAGRWDIPAARVNRLEDLEEDPHLKDVQFFVDAKDSARSYRFPRNPVRLSDSQVAVTPPPKLGADTVEVLREAGLTADQISAATA